MKLKEKAITFTVSSNLKYLRINLTEDMKVIHTETYKALLRSSKYLNI